MKNQQKNNADNAISFQRVRKLNVRIAVIKVRGNQNH